MNISGWYSGFKVEASPWIDGETIYFSVSYYLPGSSISRPPKWEKTVYITDNESGRNIVQNFTDSLTNYIARLNIPQGGHAVLTF